MVARSVWFNQGDCVQVLGQPEPSREVLATFAASPAIPDDNPMTANLPGPDDSRPAGEPLRELTLGRSRPASDTSNRPEPRSSPIDKGAADLESIAAHCRAKADAARWAAERQRRIREQYGWTDEGAPADPAIVEWAEKLTDSFYWANAADASGLPDIALLDHVAGCFETVAEALAFVKDERDRHGGLERALKLLAEAQSSLRQSLRNLRAPDDADQLAVYEWLRATAARHRIFLQHFMRADEHADPADWTGLLARIETAAGSRPQSQRQRALLDHLRDRLRQIGDQGERTSPDRQAVIRAVEDILDAGVAPSNRELRDLILPVIDKLPEQDGLPPGCRLVLRELDRYLATRQPAPSATAAPEPTGEVQQAARLLSGRSVVLIGGIRRPAVQKMLRAALGLDDLIWIETKEHQSIGRFEPVVARADVALVLLAIRWSSHAFGDVKQFCDQYGKPLVRLPAGYSPNQVAAQIITQAASQLGGKSPGS